MTRRQLPLPSSVISQLRNIILHHHADLDGACAAVGVAKSRLTERQTLDLQQSYRQATSLLRASLMARVLDSKDDDRLLAQQIEARERQQSAWSSPESATNLYKNQPDDVLGALEAFYSGDEGAFEKLIEDRVHSRLLALRGPEETLNGRRRRRLEDRNVSRPEGVSRQPPLDPTPKISTDLVPDHQPEHHHAKNFVDEGYSDQYFEPTEQPSAPRVEQQPKRSTGSFWSIQDGGIHGQAFHTEEYTDQPVKKNRKWPPTESKTNGKQPFYNEQTGQEE